MAKQYSFLYGNKGRRKFRAPWYADKWRRDMEAAGYAQQGFRVRKVERTRKASSTTV